MKSETLLKTVTLSLITIGVFSVGTSLFARYKRNKDEKETEEAIEDAEKMVQNFSGFRGEGIKEVNRPKIPTSRRKINNPIYAQKVDRLRGFYSNGGSERVTGWCYESRKGVLYQVKCKKGQPKYPVSTN